MNPEMINIRFYLLLFPISITSMHLDSTTVFAKLGETIHMSCFYHDQLAMHYSWYKHELGQNPRLISTIYKYDQKVIFYQHFKNSLRFSVLNDKDHQLHQLVIKNLQFSDSATYYCGSAYSNVLEFIQGTELIVQGIQNYSILSPIHPEESVSLQCTVLNQSCVGNHSVYWLIRISDPSPPRIIKAHRIHDVPCEWSNKELKCFYTLSKDLRITEAETHYCAVITCGEFLFGNGNRIHMIGDDPTELISTIVLLSIIRILLLLIAIATITFWYCKHSKKIAQAGFSTPPGKIERMTC